MLVGVFSVLFVVMLKWVVATDNGYMDDFEVVKSTDAGSAAAWTTLSVGAKECGFYTERRCESACFLAAADQARRAYERLAFCWEVVWEPRALRVNCLVPMMSRGTIQIYVGGIRHNCTAGNSSRESARYHGPKYYSTVCSAIIDTPDAHLDKLFQCQYSYVDDQYKQYTSSLPLRYTLDAFILRDNGTVEKPTFLNVKENFYVDLSNRNASVDCYVKHARVGSQLELLLLDNKRDGLILAMNRTWRSDERELRLSFSNFSLQSSGNFVTCRHRHLSNRTADSQLLHLVRGGVTLPASKRDHFIVVITTLGILLALAIVFGIGSSIVIWRQRRRIRGLAGTPDIAAGRQGELSMGRSVYPPELPSRNQENGYVSMFPAWRGRKWMPIYDQLRFGLTKQNTQQNGDVSEGVYEDIDEVLPCRPRLRVPAESPGLTPTPTPPRRPH